MRGGEEVDGGTHSAEEIRQALADQLAQMGAKDRADSALVSAVVLVSVPVSGAVAVSLPDPTSFVVVSAG